MSAFSPLLCPERKTTNRPGSCALADRVADERSGLVAAKTRGQTAHLGDDLRSLGRVRSNSPISRTVILTGPYGRFDRIAHIPPS